MSRRSSGSILLLLLVTVLVVALARPDASATVDGTIGELAALQEDVAGVAEDRGWTFDEAWSKLSWQNEWGLAVGELMIAHGDLVTGAETVLERSDRHVRVTVPQSSVDSRVREIVDPMRLDVEWVLNGPVDALTLREQLITLAARLDEQDIPREVDTSPSGTITVRTQTDTRPAVESLREEDPAFGAPNVAFDYVDRDLREDSRPEHDILGGGILGMSGSSTVRCSSSFSALNQTTNHSGVLTAGHCYNDANRARNDDHSSTGGATWDVLAWYYGGLGDAAFGKTFHPEISSFYYDHGNSIRTVTAVGYPVVGNTLYGFGQNGNGPTGFNRGWAIVECTPCARDVQFVATSMDRGVLGDGDSGGPWYFGTTAYGIHSGGAPDFFTPIAEVSRALGWDSYKIKGAPCNLWHC